jgi:hypothetical protein
MNARVTTGIVGVLSLALAFAGLVYPRLVMDFLGFLPEDPAHPAAALGEVRATYGGVFLVLGVYTLLSAAEPATHRARLLAIGLVWIGAAAGRLFGVAIDGSPGLFGWLSAGFEMVMGGTLVLAALGVGARPAESPA